MCQTVRVYTRCLRRAIGTLVPHHVVGIVDICVTRFKYNYIKRFQLNEYKKFFEYVTFQD